MGAGLPLRQRSQAVLVVKGATYKSGTGGPDANL